MIKRNAPGVYLFECTKCHTNIYSDRRGTTDGGCFFCGKELRLLAEVDRIPEEIKRKNYTSIDWKTKFMLLLERLF